MAAITDVVVTGGCAGVTAAGGGAAPATAEFVAQATHRRAVRSNTAVDARSKAVGDQARPRRKGVDG
ncbi:hypothetical protein [Streptomyces kurssanovii]|uniref:Uncharacterized protein n=1 Tax=Streptomyces kurssanovii TaxID=67312 RepID=A0ABV3HPK4_9ACTN